MAKDMSELGKLVKNVLITGKPQNMTAENRNIFHAEFSESIHLCVSQNRLNQRAASVAFNSVFIR